LHEQEEEEREPEAHKKDVNKEEGGPVRRKKRGRIRMSKM
jgi:hypothetical protein